MVGCTGTFVLLSVTAIFLLGHLPMASGGADRPWKAPPGGLDGYTTGLGFMDVSSDEFYHDADERPIQKEGMPVEMKKMIAPLSKEDKKAFREAVVKMVLMTDISVRNKP